MRTPAQIARSRDQHATAARVGVHRTADNYGDTYYLMIQARRNWAPPEITAQDFGLAVTITADEPRLYSQVQQRVRARERVRRRA